MSSPGLTGRPGAPPHRRGYWVARLRGRWRGCVVAL